MLTKRQKEILDFIKSYINDNGYAPTLEEIAENFGLSSVGTVAEHLEKIEVKGYLKREDNQPRAINLIESEPVAQIPLAGFVSAGKPIEPVENTSVITVPKDMLPTSGEYFALKIDGDSMIEENIHDGDIIIVRKQSSVENGETAIVYIPLRDEATVKKVYKEKNRIRLQPANPGMKPIYAKQVEIKGKVVGAIKKFV